jgi:hypothetical protein
MFLIKLLISGQFWIGLIVGGMAMFILKPLVDSVLQKMFNKNQPKK